MGVFCAALPPPHALQRLSASFVRVALPSAEKGAEELRHFYLRAPDDKSKLGKLVGLLNRQLAGTTPVLVFVRSTRTAAAVAAALRDAGFAVACGHGEMGHEVVDAAVAAFRSGAAKVLVATDLLARGIDFSKVPEMTCLELSQSRESACRPPAAILIAC